MKAFFTNNLDGIYSSLLVQKTCKKKLTALTEQTSEFQGNYYSSWFLPAFIIFVPFFLGKFNQMIAIFQIVSFCCLILAASFSDYYHQHCKKSSNRAKSTYRFPKEKKGQCSNQWHVSNQWFQDNPHSAMNLQKRRKKRQWDKLQLKL